MNLIRTIRKILDICLWMLFLVLSVPSIGYSFPYKGLDIKIIGAINEMYNDNIESNSKNKKQDFITMLDLIIGLKHDGKTRTINFTGHIKDEIYPNYSKFNNMSGDVTLNFENEFTEYDRIILSNTFNYTFEPASFEEEFRRTGGRSRSSNNNFSLIYSKDIGRQFVINTNYINSIFKVDNEGGNNSYQNSLGFRVNYEYSIATFFYLTYEVNKRSFEELGSDSTQTFTARIRQYITKRLYFDGLIGIDFITTTGGKKQNGEYIAVSLAEEVDKNTAANFSFLKRKEKISFTNEIFDSWRISGFLTRQLSEKLYFTFSGFYGQGTYELSDQTNKFLGTDIEFIYDITENLKGNIKYTHSENKSTDFLGSNKYYKNVIFSGLSFGF